MKKWQKVLLGSAGLLVAGSLLVACGSNSSKSSSSDSKTLKLWVPTGAKKSYSDTVAQFERNLVTKLIWLKWKIQMLKKT